jgi:hypothetical protein
MPYVAAIGTYVPCRVGARPMAEVHDFRTGNELISYEDLGFAERLRGLRTRRSGGRDYRQGGLGGARISLAHNTIPSVVSAVTNRGGATYGAR